MSRINKLLIVTSFILLFIIIAELFYYFRLQKNSTFQPTKGIINKGSSSSILEARCPKGFILVKGSHQFKTNDFCVMKYEAKCDIDGDGIGDINGPNARWENLKDWEDKYYDAWDNRSLPCQSKSRQVVSTAQGWPIGKVSQLDAINLCSSQGWRLLSNPEYMTIARDAEKQTVNWCTDNTGGECGLSLGIGTIIKGHADYQSTTVYQASPQDQEECYGTVVKNTNVSCGTAKTERRTLTLSNGEYIWDFSGNMWELLNNSINESTGIGWGEFTDQNASNIVKDSGPSNAAWDSSQGMGKIYHAPSSQSANFAVIRSGGSDGGDATGIYTLVLDHKSEDNTYPNVGFRCVTIVDK